MSTAKAFNKRYSMLTKTQKEAVDSIEGPVMVIAGPGTGKTTILTLRIASILQKTDTSPENILALTFTESGVVSMRKKLREIIGTPAYNVRIHTFHGFCERVIQEHPDAFPRIIGSNHVSDIERTQIIESIIAEGDFDHLKPYGNPAFYVGPARSAIQDLKRENVSPDDFHSLIQEQEREFENIPDLYHEKGAFEGKMKGKYQRLQKAIEKNKELRLIFEEYQNRLAESNLYDYEDMIMETVRALRENDDLRLALQETYQYVLADEHQDANRAQNALLEELTNFFEHPNLFIVGDEKQAIFRFQGASLENFLYFKERFPSGKLIVLADNFRSTQPILDATQAMMEKNEVPYQELRKRLTARSPHASLKESIEVREYSGKDHELSSTAESVRQCIAQGTAPDEIAVLFRNNKEADELIPHLRHKGIPFVVESKVNILEDPLVAQGIDVLRTLDEIGSDERIARLLYMKGLHLPPLDVYRAVVYARREYKDLAEVLGSKKELERAGVKGAGALHDVYKKLIFWKKKAEGKPLIEIFPEILKEFGILQSALEARTGSLENLQRLFQEIKLLSQTHPLLSYRDFLSHIDVIGEHNVEMESEAGNAYAFGVRLMTAHRSKGLEFDVVFIVGVNDGRWGNKRSIRYFHIPIEGLQSAGFNANEDERRLLYVAITRARRHCLLSFSRIGEDGKELLPSQFLEELDPKYVEWKSFEKEEEDENGEPFTPRAVELPMPRRVYLRALFLERPFSVTALNNYLTCPWRYFFRNLVRIPEVPNKFQTYGIAVHEALRMFFDAYRQEKNIGKDDLISFFERSIRKHAHSKEEYEELVLKGRESLSGFYDAYRGAWRRNLINEYAVRGVEIDFEAEKGKEVLELSARLDKVELLDDGGKVNVVDYKTGKPKSRNAIEGKTKNSNGDYKRQLVFYKLLLDASSKGKKEMVSGELDFVEPNNHGNFKKERFEISEEETRGLQGCVQKTARDIYNLAFWNTFCEEKDCQYCALRRQMENG